MEKGQELSEYLDFDNTTQIIVVVLSVIAVLIITTIICYCCCRLAKKKAKKDQISEKYKQGRQRSNPNNLSPLQTLYVDATVDESN